MLAALLLVTATFHPARPTVGDPITIDFAKPVVLERSAAYEVVSQQGSRVVVRTFEPRPFALNGTTDGVLFRDLVIPVRSVLAPKDSLQPAPLKPPRKAQWPRDPLIAIGIAGVAAALAWALVYVAHRRAHQAVRQVVIVPPADRFRAAIGFLLKTRPTAQRWAMLADATREYLDARGFGSELTTSQILAELHSHEIIAEVLRRGDLEKFSPWGAPPGDFTALAHRALQLPEEFEPKPQEEVAA